jgi:hypothetical protein
MDIKRKLSMLPLEKTTVMRSILSGMIIYHFSVIQSSDWWVNTGANIHICSDLSLFSSY